jgi:hypothetical protein
LRGIQVSAEPRSRNQKNQRNLPSKELVELDSVKETSCFLGERLFIIKAKSFYTKLKGSLATGKIRIYVVIASLDPTGVG